MISRRRRSRGGYMIRVPATADTPTITTTNYIYSLLLGDTLTLNQFNLTAYTNDLHVVNGTIRWSPIVYILQSIYEDNLLKEIYVHDNVIKFIAFTSPETSQSQADNVEIVAQSVNISYLQNDDYTIMKHLTVDTVGGFTQVQTYLFPIPVDSTDKTILKSLTKVTLTYQHHEPETSIFSQDMQYNSVIDNYYFIQIQVNQRLEEAFTKYVVCYDNNTNHLFKFKEQINKNIGNINENILEEFTP